jgi:homoserine dehydrogenase
MRLDLVLVGFGNVARRFVRLAREKAGALERDHDLSIRICGIVTARHGSTFDEAGVDAVAAADAREAGRALGEPRPAADVIRQASALGQTGVLVETTPLNVQTGQPAIDHVRAALRAGLHVVTANKGPGAIAWKELAQLARERGVSFLFEGAVMDGVPVFNLVRETMPGVQIGAFRGVVNSTTNYILTILEDGGEFDDALDDMQRAGITEADPSLDVDGWDAAAKTSALANVLMRADLTPEKVERTGIRGITGAAVRGAVGRGNRIRLVASVENGRARVRPEELPATDPLAQLRGLQNAIVFQTDVLGEIAVTQLGGGLTQTAYALVSDLVTVARRIRSAGGAPVR